MNEALLLLRECQELRLLLEQLVDLRRMAKGLVA